MSSVLSWHFQSQLTLSRREHVNMVIFCKCITYPISTGKWTNGLEATEAHTSKEGQDHEEQHDYGEDGQGLLWTCDRHTVFTIKYILKPGFTVLSVFFFLQNESVHRNTGETLKQPSTCVTNVWMTVKWSLCVKVNQTVLCPWTK